jgi:1-acyl-sn-glycerol-3-phosphate acyltransferase
VRESGTAVTGPVTDATSAIVEEAYRLPGTTADPFGLDLAFRDSVAPVFEFLHDVYWRVEVSGVQHIPQHGPVLLVANHSGAIPFDGSMIVSMRFLYDRFVANVALVDRFYRKVGGAIATRDNAEMLLRAGEAVLLFPEGVPGVAKTFTDRYRLRPFSPGFARMAMKCEAPVVPVAVVGAEEIYPMVGRAEAIGKKLGMPYVPITPFFPLLGPLGALPLPTKWFIRFGKPIRITAPEDEARAKAAADDVRRRLQAMVTRLKRRRQSIFFG